MDIKERLHITKGTVRELTDLEECESINELKTYLERELSDTTFFFNDSLDALIVTLSYNGIMTEEIVRRNKAKYGAFINFTYFTDLEIYVMGYGVR